MTLVVCGKATSIGTWEVGGVGDWLVLFAIQWMVIWQAAQRLDPHVYIYLPIKPNVYNTRFRSRYTHDKVTVTSLFVWKLELSRGCFLLQTKKRETPTFWVLWLRLVVTDKKGRFLTIMVAWLPCAHLRCKTCPIPFRKQVLSRTAFFSLLLLQEITSIQIDL